jgi:hypothetical protein
MPVLLVGSASPQPFSRNGKPMQILPASTFDAVDCPHCDGNNLCHESVEVFYRNGEDNAEGVHATVNPHTVTVGQSMSGNPSSRRGGLLVHFSCETCPVKPVLEIIQHKGCTYMQWRK